MMAEHVSQAKATREPLAIIGIGCRFPGGGSDPERFWSFLVDGCDGFRDIPQDRWDIARYYDPNNARPGMASVRQAAFLDEPIDHFDAYFFGITPREAEVLDPQQRLLLEVSWEALEDAGLPPTRLAGSQTGVYMGGFTVDALLHHLSESNRDLIGPHTATSATLVMLSNRLSHFYGFHGPSFTVDTACSSSLVAFHYACCDLWSHRTEAALAGGVNVMIKPEFPIAMSKGGFLAPDARSKAFDHRANGYARGEGAAIVVIKRLGDALQDGDGIYALVRGTGVNQDGRTDGITVPNGIAQEDLIRAVYGEAGIDPRDVGYFEAHGTGTAVGDPTEAGALAKVLKDEGARKEPCLVGSVKANIGHLEAAAGVAGVVKAALCLKHREVPPQIQIERLNPGIPFEEYNVRVPQAREPLRRGDRPLYASINSFGYGGTNAHAVFEAVPPSLEARSWPECPCHERPYFLPLSARSDEALVELGGRYAERIARDPSDLDDVCYSAARRRAHLSHRFAVVATDKSTLCDKLQSIPTKTSVRGSAAASPGVAFVLTGMGPQWWGMGRELLRSEPRFREAAETADAAFARHSGWSVLAEMGADAATSRVTQNFVAQPANFVLQVALAALWESWGTRPAAIVGHSVGEIAASYLAGGLSLEDAALVIFHRSRAQQKLVGAGTMLATELDPELASQLIREHGGEIDIATVNAPASLVLSGDADALAEIAGVLESLNLFNRFLKVEVPYHSRAMEPASQELLSSLTSLSPKSTEVPFYSPVTGRMETGVVHDASYWSRNVLQPVLFEKATQALLADGYEVFLQIGPHPVLGAAIMQTAAAEGRSVAVLGSLHRDHPEAQTMLEAMGGLFEAGLDIDFAGLFPAGRFTSLPLYPWQKERFWLESERSKDDRMGSHKHPLLGGRTDDPGHSWQSTLGSLDARYLGDHRVQGSVVFPGAGYAEIALAASRQVAESERTGIIINSVQFDEPLIIPPHAKPLIRSVLNTENRTLEMFGSLAGEDERWTRVAKARLSDATPKSTSSMINAEEARRRCGTEIAVEEFYRALRDRGLEYGPYFQRIQELYAGPGEVFAEIEPHPALTEDDETMLHPTVLDSAFQSLVAGFDNGAQEAERGVYVPVLIDSLALHSTTGRERGAYLSYGRIVGSADGFLDADISIFNECGDLIADVRGLRCQRVSVDASAHGPQAADWLYAYAWQAISPPAASQSQRLHVHMLDPEGAVSAALGDIVASELGIVPHLDPPARSVAEIHDRIRPDETNCIIFVTWIDREDPTGERECLRLLSVVQTLVAKPEHSTRLIVAVRGLHGVEGGAVGAPAQASIWGLGRTLLSEHPELRVSLIDLPSAPVEAASALLSELRAEPPEEEVAWRRGQRFVHRLGRTQPNAGRAEEQIRVSSDHPFVLDNPFGKGVENLSFREATRRPPGQGEIELQFTHASLNFKDILKMMGLLSARRLQETFFEHDVGMEAAARVIAVGPDITSLAPGDQVIATVDGGCFRSFATVRERQTHALPAIPGHALAALAGCPIAFITAYYALHEVARVQPGEKVLLHSAAGGVGLAALQVARWLDADVIATAGSEDKRQHLRGQGVARVLDSRSLSFAHEVLELTDGEGVDVILSFLTGEALDLNLQILKPFGRLLEIGKRDIEADRGLPMSAFDRSLTFAAIDIDRMLAIKPDLFDRMYAAVWERIKAGDFAPLSFIEWPISELRDACRTMMRAEHIGKLIVRIEGEEVEVSPLAQAQTLIRADGVYLVTGGLSGFGAAMAQWLVEQGARYMLLIGRRGLESPGGQELVSKLESRGANVHAGAADVADADTLNQILDDLDPTWPPLRGVFHTAAVLDDGLISQMTAEQFGRTMRSKATGAWNLHVLAEQHPLDHFVLFSSVSALVGNAGQGNYVAANCFLDALARERRSQGLPGLSVNWGVIGDVGMAARDRDVGERLERLGMRPIPPMEAITAMAPFLQESDHSNIGVFDIDWDRWTRSGAASSISRFGEVAALSAAAGSKAGEIIALLGEMEPGERHAALTELVAEQIAVVLRMPVEKLPIHQPLSDLGVDSLTMVELQLALERAFGAGVPALELARIGGVAPLAELILGSIMPSSSDAAKPAPAALNVEAHGPRPAATPSASEAA